MPYEATSMEDGRPRRLSVTTLTAPRRFCAILGAESSLRVFWVAHRQNESAAAACTRWDARPRSRKALSPISCTRRSQREAG